MRTTITDIADKIYLDAVRMIKQGAIVRRHAAGGSCIVGTIAFNDKASVNAQETIDFLTSLTTISQQLNATGLSENDLKAMHNYSLYIQSIIDIIIARRGKEDLCDAFLELAAHRALTKLTFIIKNSSKRMEEMGTRALSTIDVHSFAKNTSSNLMTTLKQYEFADTYTDDEYSTGSTQETIAIDAHSWHNFTAGVYSSTSAFCSWSDAKTKALKQIHLHGLQKFPVPARIPLHYMQLQMRRLIDITAQKRSSSTATSKSFAYLQNAIAADETLRYVAADFNENVLLHNSQTHGALPLQVNSRTKFIMRSPINMTETSAPDSTYDLPPQQTTAYEARGLISQVSLPEILSDQAINKPLVIHNRCSKATWSWNADIKKLLGNNEDIFINNQVNYLCEICNSNEELQIAVSKILKQTTIARYAGESVCRLHELLSLHDKLAIISDMAETLHILEFNKLYYSDISPANILWDGEQARFCDFDSIMHPCAEIGKRQPSSTYPHKVDGGTKFTNVYAHKIGIATLLYYLADKEDAELFIPDNARFNAEHGGDTDENILQHEQELKGKFTAMLTSSSSDTKELAELGLQILSTATTQEIKDISNYKKLLNTEPDKLNTRDTKDVVEFALHASSSASEDIDSDELEAYWESLSPSLHFNERYAQLTKHIIDLSIQTRPGRLSCFATSRQQPARTNSASLVYSPGNRQASLFRENTSLFSNTAPGLDEINLDSPRPSSNGRSSESISFDHINPSCPHESMRSGPLFGQHRHYPSRAETQSEAITEHERQHASMATQYGAAY